MGYYGDYRGDYYRGDPVFGVLAKAAGGLASKLLPKAAQGIVGLAKKGVQAIVKRPVSTGITVATTAAAARATTGSSRPGIPLPGNVRVQPRNIIPGGRPFITADQCPKGYHINKAVQRWEVAVQNGSNAQQPQYVNYCVKHRSMNIGNGKALVRAARRGKAFIKSYRKVARMFGGARKSCASCAKKGRR